MPTSYIYVPTVDEAALSDGGRWIGGASGGSWRTPVVQGGQIFANGENTDPDDTIACINRAIVALSGDYYIAARVSRDIAYVPVDGHEVEIWPAMDIVNGSAKGIEVTFQYFSDASSQNLQAVIWNGPFNSFDTSTLGGISVSGGFQIRGGDELAARKSGNDFFIYHNDVQLTTFNIAGFSNMSPGIGMFMRPNGIARSYCYDKVSVTAAANTAFIPSQVYAPGTRSFVVNNLDANLSLVKIVLSREGWPVGSPVCSVIIDCAVNGVNFQPVAGATFAGGDLTFKGRPVTHNRMITTLPAVGTPGRAMRITFANSVSLRSAVSGLMF